ncbi:MAG: L-seryl-tRNA(Sec) selenium transferase, partial [Fuerstiella sp.]|nr:L-seryl-tRNA(Sec) selenium transferase [Fuerstiella sp.]
MPSAQYLRSLPAVDHVLRHPLLLSVTTVFPRQQIVAWIRQSIDACRAAILAGEELDAKAATDFVVHQVLKFSQIEDGRRQQPVINATGILLHTNLGRAPLAARAVERMKESSGYANVEMNLQTGKRNKRGERVCELLRQLTGAEDAAVVNNCAAATMLVLQTLAAGKEVIVSRGQLVEIGGGFRLPEVFSASGAMLTEIGTTNRTYLGDYQDAITENTGAIIRVHRSNFFQGGFVTEPDIADLVALGLERNVPVVDDVGSGCMQDLTTFGLREPTVPDSVAAGADLTLFSGDKLFGGPQAGIIVGKSQWIEALRQNPMMRALRVDKMTLAAVEATAEIHMAGTTSDEIPLT